MSLVFYFLVCLIFVIVQTTLFQSIDLFKHFYDPMVPFIVYLGIHCPFRISIPMVIVAGLMMDSVTSGPLGMYVTIYIWLFIASRWVIQYLHDENIFLIAILIAAGVVLENLIILGGLMIKTPLYQLSVRFIAITLQQAVLALFTGPILIIFLKYIQSHIAAWDFFDSRKKDKIDF